MLVYILTEEDMGRFWILSAAVALCASSVLAQDAPDASEIDREYHKMGISKRDTTDFLELVRRQSCICKWNICWQERRRADLGNRHMPIRYMRLVLLRSMLHWRWILLLL